MLIKFLDMSQAGPLSETEANDLVLEHRGWAESIARSVARAWNMDWQLDGLDGAAMEALIFCSRRFDPVRGVPFRGYARKRIHEASTDAARRSRGWVERTGGLSKSDAMAREVSSELLNLYPELRVGQLPQSDDADHGGDGGGSRGAVRQLLVSATIIAAKQGMDGSAPDELVDYKRMLNYITGFEPIHQLLLWKLYWEGLSLRQIAVEWETDELNVIREHKALLAHLQRCISKGKVLERIKVRPGLKTISLKLKRSSAEGQFSKLLGKG